MNTRTSVPVKRKIDSLVDIFDDPTIRTIGVVADVNQGKTNTLNALIKSIQLRKKDASIWTSGLRVKLDGVKELSSITELETMFNSVVVIDEFPDFYNLYSTRDERLFEKSLRKVNHDNNLIIICGLARNFNKRLGALLQAVIFKQSTLEDFVQRSPLDMAIKSYSSNYGSEIQKGNAMLTMPKDKALYHEIYTKRWYELDVPYLKDVDAKRNNIAIV